MTENILDKFTYILVDREPVQHPNDDEWFLWFGNMDNRRVASTDIGEMWVSTVFGGIDRSYGRAERPLVFETMLFDANGKSVDEWLTATWAEAEAKHAEVVEQVKANAS